MNSTDFIVATTTGNRGMAAGDRILCLLGQGSSAVSSIILTAHSYHRRALNTLGFHGFWEHLCSRQKAGRGATLLRVAFPMSPYSAHLPILDAAGASPFSASLRSQSLRCKRRGFQNFGQHKTSVSHPFRRG